ncbi:hypothetical protein EVA_22129, partial [gut metagenome]
MSASPQQSNEIKYLALGYPTKNTFRR